MKKYIFLLFSLILLTLTAVKCKKGDNGFGQTTPQLPPITDTGANTFGCKVNGNVWLPYGGWNINAISINAFIGNRIKNPELDIISKNRYNGAASDILITVTNLKADSATYKIYNYLNTGLLYSDGDTNYEPFDSFGVVHISRCDTIKKIISGTFSFKAYTGTNHSTSQSVTITDGRFDFHYPMTIH